MESYSNGSPTLDQEEMMVPSLSDENNKPTHPLPSPSSDPPPPKRSRRSVQKRVVNVPFLDADGNRPKGLGECSPPSDSWAWRKYGQKPIKGSPYPRGYYRCSSSKGCPARKQVERSRADPTTLVITYSFDHNHAWPMPRSHHHHPNSRSKSQTLIQKPLISTPQPDLVTTTTSQPDKLELEDHQKPIKEEIEKSSFMDLITAPAAAQDDFFWFSTDMIKEEKLTEDPLLYGSIFGGIDVATLVVPLKDESEGFKEGVDESLFAELDELPDCEIVFRRGNFGFPSWCGTATG
ncbi:hypothetical protein LUZ60_008447 [Juncus effusus]|nr:hypothetical protein LUZ60_008447 [Juncus effusus]